MRIRTSWTGTSPGAWAARAGMLIALSAIPFPAQQIYTGTVGVLRAGYFQLDQSGRAPVWVRTQGAVEVAGGRFSHAPLQAGNAVQVTGKLSGSMIWASRITVLGAGAGATPAAFTANAPPSEALRSAPAAAQAAPSPAGGSVIDCNSLRYSNSNGSTELVCTTTLSPATRDLILAALGGRTQSLQLAATTSDRMGRQMKAMTVRLRNATVTGWKLTDGEQLEVDFKPGQMTIALER